VSFRSATEPRIVDAATPEAFDAARALFREYAAGLGVSLCFQGFEQELTVIETMYAPPRGALLLLEREAGFGGCVGLRPLGEECEMKRLYVKSELRGLGCGRRLARAAIERARTLGYRRVYLDTLPAMTEARALYADMGFVDTPPYYMNPVEGVTYLVKDLASPIA
jgi:GNAT superfamily N-acetyltransferase